MKNIVLIIGLLVFMVNTSTSQEVLSPYFEITGVKGSADEIKSQLTEAISNGGFEVIGAYHPANNKNFTVVCFTNEALKNLSLQFEDRGTLASVLKAAIIDNNDTVTVSILNPEYMFLAYWGQQLDGQEKQLKEMSEKVKNIFSSLGKLEPFGGEVEAEDLPDYRYMIMMPYFDDPEELNEFESFEQGLEIIRKNLNEGKGMTIKVYEQLFESEKIAVFGVGLNDVEEGEAHFLPIIGEGNIANLPYEIILQGKEATMLHGKYRIALYWPELKLGQFMKISSTPGNIEDVMEALTEDGDDD